MIDISAGVYCVRRREQAPWPKETGFMTEDNFPFDAAISKYILGGAMFPLDRQSVLLRPQYSRSQIVSLGLT
jgi:hypothetical protein